MAQTEASDTVAAARAGDEEAFAALAERYRGELQVHCYRLLGSLEDSEDLVQETFLRAWRSRRSFRGESSFRAWMYSIATNACLDALERRPRVARPDPERPGPDVPWLQPYPDRLLEALPSPDEQPHAELVAKETVELAFIAAIQLLPPKQRAVLISRDVLGWSAAECAALLETTVPAVNSALQRARATMKRNLPRARSEWPSAGDPKRAERMLLERYMEAAERGDPEGIARLLREDAFCAMPPTPDWWVGNDKIVEAWGEGGFGDESWGRLGCRLTGTNRQPAVAAYVKRPRDESYTPLALDVLRIEEGRVAEIIVFPLDEMLVNALGLPPKL